MVNQTMAGGGPGVLVYVEAYPTNEGLEDATRAPQAYLVNLSPGPGRPLDWYPWEVKELKELCKAVAEDGPNSPWAQTL